MQYDAMGKKMMLCNSVWHRDVPYYIINNTLFGKEITVPQDPNGNMLQMMHRDINANLYPMHTFKLMHRIANFYADTPVRIGEFYHP